MKIPGVLVDCVVVAERPGVPHADLQRAIQRRLCGRDPVPMSAVAGMAASERKIIAAGRPWSFGSDAVVNLGIGMPEGVANVAAEEQVIDLLTLTAEPGVIGGIPAGGLSFGAAINAEAIIDQPSQFDFYDGGGLDIAFLAGAGRPPGQSQRLPLRAAPGRRGWFINISQNAKKVVFVGTFTAGELRLAIEDGKLRILQDGRPESLSTRSSNAPSADRRPRSGKKTVLYVTERCVFRLCDEGLELVEIARGRSAQGHPRADGFRAGHETAPVLMDERIFRDEPMKLRRELLEMRSNSASRSMRSTASSSSISKAWRCAARPTSSASAKPSRPPWHRSAASRWTPSSTTTASPSCRSWWMNTRAWSRA